MSGVPIGPSITLITVAHCVNSFVGNGIQHFFETMQLFKTTECTPREFRLPRVENYYYEPFYKVKNAKIPLKMPTFM